MFRRVPTLILGVCWLTGVMPASAQAPSAAEKTARESLEKLGILVQVQFPPRPPGDFPPEPGKDKKENLVVIIHPGSKFMDADALRTRIRPGGARSNESSGAPSGRPCPGAPPERGTRGYPVGAKKSAEGFGPRIPMLT
jgi:hypothetical protein